MNIEFNIIPWLRSNCTSDLRTLMSFQRQDQQLVNNQVGQFQRCDLTVQAEIYKLVSQCRIVWYGISRVG